MDSCEGCKWWSQLCAQSFGCGPMEALCLNHDSPEYNRMVCEGCPEYEEGVSVDDPSRPGIMA